MLRRLEYPKAVVAGSMMPIHMWWLNAGVAPPYINYPLAIQLRSANDSAVINVPVDIKKWLPGDAVYDGSLYVPETLPDGTYDFRVAMLDPRSDKPAIRFAIAGRGRRWLVQRRTNSCERRKGEMTHEAAALVVTQV